MPFRKRFRRRPMRMLRRKRRPDLVPFVICNECFSTFQAGSPHDGCLDRNDPAFVTTVATVAVDGGAFSALGTATAGMSRGLKFRGMQFDLRLHAGYRTLNASDGSILGPCWLYYAVGLAKVGTVDSNTNGRAIAALPNLWASAEEFFNADLIYLKKGRVFVPPIINPTAANETFESWGSNDGMTYWDRANAPSDPGVTQATNNATGNQIHHRVKTRRNVNEDEAIVWAISAYALRTSGVNANHAGSCANFPPVEPIQVNYNVEGMLVLENWQS